MTHRGSLLLGVVALLSLAPRPAHAQCPDGTPPPCRTAAATRQAAPAPSSIAVLPFANRSPDSSDAYLAEGMTDEVGNRLAQLGRLQVKARGQVAAQWARSQDALTAARALRVAWVVHGNVRRAGGQLVVNVELVRAPSGEEAWAARFPRRDADVFAVQAEVAESVAAVVAGRLTPGEQSIIARRPTRNNEAWRLYLLANSLVARRTEQDLRQAVTMYQRAVALDPTFAAAWARLGRTRTIQVSWGWEAETGDSLLYARALVEARRALSLDSLLAEGYLALGSLLDAQGDMTGSHDALEKALRLDSSSADIFHHYGSGIYSSDCPSSCFALPRYAIPLFRRAVALDPTLRNTWRHLAASERDSGLLAESEAHLDTALSLGPWPPGSADRAWVRYLRGNIDGALADHAAGRGSPQSRPMLEPLIGLARADSSAVRAALETLRADTLDRFGSTVRRAYLALSLGLRDEALSALEALRRIPSGPPARCGPDVLCSPSMPAWRFLRDHYFASLRNEPRFQRLWNELRPRVPWLPPPDGP